MTAQSFSPQGGSARQARSDDADPVMGRFNGDAARLLSRCCIFLDLDGTLIESSDNPIGLKGDAKLTALLQRAADALNGALAVVSGRSLATLDAMLAPLRLPASGIFGLERRDAGGVLHSKAVSVRALDPVRDIFADFAAESPGLIVEDKGTAVALHFRRAPAFGAASLRVAHATAAMLGPRFQVVAGTMVVEITLSGTNQATAIEEFLREPPFAGRIPIALGDDICDRDAFAAANRHGGFTVAVGSRISGDYHLEDCRAARRWLSALVGVE